MSLKILVKHTTHDIQLKNGARLLAIDVPSAIAASFTVAARAGYLFAPKSKYELPHLLEHLAFSGNKKFPSLEEFMYAIEKTGAWQNATTSPTMVRYYFGAPREELKNVVGMMMSMVSAPLFAGSAVKHEIGVVHAELSRKIENDSIQAAVKNSLSAFPAFLPLEKRLKTLERISHGDIVNYHHGTHGGANLAFVVATDFSNGLLGQLEKLLNNELSSMETGKLLDIPKRRWSNFAGKVHLIKPRALNQHNFSLSFYTDIDGHGDAPVLRILHSVYNKGMGSRLFIKTRQRGLSYGSSTGYSAARDYVEFYIDDRTTPEKFLPLFEVCLRELADIADGNITEREFERARGYNIGGYELDFQRPVDFASWYGQDYVEGCDLESPDEYLDKLKSVKKSDLSTVAKKYIKADNWVLTLCGNNVEKESFKKVLERYLK